MPTPYRLAADTFGAEEIEAAKAVLDSGRMTMGERVAAFESEFAAWVGTRHALMVNSGSSANLLMVDTLLRRTKSEGPLKRGDEVLVPGLSWPTTVWPLVQLGLVPVFVDAEPATLAIDLESARAAIGPRTRGMFLIHVLGRALNMDEYLKFCAKHGLKLLEDTCESLGAHWAGRHAGTFAETGSFSFYYSHHISTIEGGMVVTGDRALYDDLRSLRAHGWVRDRSDKTEWMRRFQQYFDERFLFVSAGYNVRPTEIQAAIGRVQLRRLDQMLEAREALARTVAGWIARIPWLELIGSETLGGAPPRERRARGHSWMTLPFRLREEAPVTRDVVIRRLERAGVETRPIIAGNLARHPASQRFETRCAASLRQSDLLLERGFMTGCHPVLAPGALETLEKALTSLAEL